MSADNLPSSLSRYLDGDFWEIKDNLREEISRCEVFQNSSYDLPLEQVRELTVQRLHFVLKLPLMKQHLRDQVAGDKQGFISKSLCITELICSADMATGIKMGVVCGLYGGAVTNLGTPEQVEKLYVPVTELKYTGMFAMTEKGHGSNVRGILTESHYDPSTQEFVIHTPCENAQKIYIGNAMKGNYAAVFAQLITNGECHGPHCFIVPIRNQKGLMCPGVTTVDMEHKEGLHGVDNGILIFDHVRIPRENLLHRFGSVSADGQYSSPIHSSGSRFNAMLAALIPTRLALTVQAMAAMKLGLIIAVRYSHRYTAWLMDEALCKGLDLQSNRPLQALVAGLKAYSTWTNVACLQECRECTGGMGFMMENRIPSLKCDSDVFVTFEGDNMVMLQVVVRELLNQYSKQNGKSPVSGLIKIWSSYISDSLRSSFPSFPADKVGDLSFLIKALNYRERILQRSLAARLHTKVDRNKEEFFNAWNSCLHHVTQLALAHVHRVTLEQFALAVHDCPVKEDQTLLQKFCLLHGTSMVYQERGWYLEHSYFSPSASKLIRRQLLDLCRSVKDDALKLVSDFNMPPCCIQAPIAGVPNSKAPWGFYPQPDSHQNQQRAKSKL